VPHSRTFALLLLRLLVTGSRAPVALELIRAFARAGHTVFAADTVRWTMGSHSRYLSRHFHIPPPRFQPEAFVGALARIADEERIDRIVPTCEEVFHLARGLRRLPGRTRVFTSPLAVLEELHHKGRFQRLAASLGIRTPRTAIVASVDELRATLAGFDGWLLKPAYSRFASRIATNRGPLAGRTPLVDVRPAEREPWLVQEFVDGPLLCSYSTLHRGRVTAHCAYETPFKVNHGSGVQFVSVDGDASRHAAARIGAARGYTGQLSLDFVQADGGLVLLECNPRATSGAHLIDPMRLVAGIVDPAAAAWTEPPGRARHLAIPLLASAAAQPRRWGALARALARGDDVVMDARDPLPALVQLRLGLRLAWLARRLGTGMAEASTHDIEWNGDA
jgi:glutathione synthase/RimK-type ligase-like ATP-grasp enzyme